MTAMDSASASHRTGWALMTDQLRLTFGPLTAKKAPITQLLQTFVLVESDLDAKVNRRSFRFLRMSSRQRRWARTYSLRPSLVACLRPTAITPGQRVPERSLTVNIMFER